MRRLLSTMLLGAAFATPSLVYAGTAPQVSVHPTARITAKVDNTKTVALSGTIPGKISLAKDLGRAASTQQMPFLRLVLKSSDEQEAALHELMDAQQDRNNPNFHKWETPDTFAANYGIASADLQKVTDWLQASGLTVNNVASGGRIITFSGPVGSIETAFHTEMHTYQVDGETALANATEVSIPAALSDVVLGPARLNNFQIKRGANASFKKLAQGKDGLFYNVKPGTKDEPDYTSTSSGNHFVSPADFATIYNTKALVASGVNGMGIKIGVVGQTLIDPADTQIFRSIFGLPNNDPTIVPGGDTPTTIADDIEADLDVQWSGAVAPQATVIYAPQGLQYYAGGGIDGSALSYINNNNVDIITMSYGGCESGNGQGYTAFWNSMWEQAAAQGQSVFVSSGDSSATGCVSSSSTTAGTTAKYAVNALGSSAYNVAVGGTMFNEGSYIEGLKTGVTKYWSAGGVIPYGTAVSYIPESVMSDGAFNQVLGAAAAAAAGNPGVFGGGGGVSVFTARPSWQTGVGIAATDPAGPVFTGITGAIPAGTPHRLVPDVSIIGSLSHDDTIICYESSCTVNPTTGLISGIGAVGGTSVATPVWASVMALIDQKNGGRQGNPNYYFYKLAAAESNLAACASKEAPLPASTCNFNDIITGDNYSPLKSTGSYTAPVLDSTGTTIVTPGVIKGTLGTDYIGFPATTGYDEATGLGSPNVANVVNNWSTISFNATTTTLALTPTQTTHGAAITATVKVTSASGTPTGDVSIIANTINGQANLLTLAAGTATGQIVNLPGGTYSVTAHYAGDATFGASTSAPATVTIAKETSDSFLEANLIDINRGAVRFQEGLTAFTYGQPIYIPAQVSGDSATSGNPYNNAPNTGVPTGTITFSVVAGATTLPSITSNLDASALTYMLTGGSYGYYDFFQNYPVLSPGSYKVTGAYSGDNSFNPSTASVSFTVSQAVVTPAISVRTPDIKSGATAIVAVTMAPVQGGITAGGTTAQTGAYPTGTATLIDNGTGATLGTGTFANGIAVINTNLILTTGAHTVHATVTGDVNYAAGTTANGTITVTTGTTPTITVTSPTAAPVVLGSTAVVVNIPAGTAGAISIYDGSTLLATGTSTASTTSLNYTATTWMAGVHSITASYGGSSTLTAVTSVPYLLTVAKNSPTLTLSSEKTAIVGSTLLLQSRVNLVPAATPLYSAAVPAPTGSVTFLDNGVAIGSGPIVYNSNFGGYDATFSGTVTAGSHTYTAVYAGDSNYNATAPVADQPVTVGVPAFNITATPSSLNIVQGRAGLTTVNVLGTAQWTGKVSLSCSGLPQYTYCNFGAASTSLYGSSFAETATPITVSIVTTAPTPPVFAGLMWIPAIFFAGFLIVRRKQLSIHGRQMLTLAVLLCGVTALSGCGKNVERTGAQNGTPLGAFTLTITGTGTGATSASASGTKSISVPVNVTAY